jgi:MinD-like ATPase involved in chromosome partitioning or flagellar assembly
MKTTLITVIGPEGRHDLAAPADSPVEDLIPTFVELTASSSARNGRWELVPPGRGPLQGDRTLAEHGVLDGGVLHLVPQAQNGTAPGGAADAAATAAPAAAAPAATSAEDGQTPLARTQAALPPRFGAPKRLGQALGAALSKEPPPAPARDEGAAPDPKALTKPVPTTPMDRFRASWRRTDYLRLLEDEIAEPKLRRCATIAVLSPKGGVGKTTLTALLGSLFALVRRDRAVAIDTNPDYGSLGRTLTPDHKVFVDDLLDILEHPDLSITQLDANLGRATDGLMVLPAPTDPARMARLDRAAYAKVIERMQAMAGLLLLDCGTGLQEPAAQAAMMAADQFVLVSDAEPSTASLVAEASALLERVGTPLTLVVNKLPASGGRLDLGELERRLPRARGMVTVGADPQQAALVAAGEFSWRDADGAWARAVRELAVVLASDWRRLGLAT